MSTSSADPSVSQEYTLRAARRVDAETQQVLLDLEVRTVREFASYGYRVDVRALPSEHAATIIMEIGGISLPSVATAASGAAVGVLSLPMPSDGMYDVHVVRKQRTARFALRIANGTPSPLDAKDGGFIVAASGS